MNSSQPIVYTVFGGMINMRAHNFIFRNDEVKKQAGGVCKRKRHSHCKFSHPIHITYEQFSFAYRHLSEQRTHKKPHKTFTKDNQRKPGNHRDARSLTRQLGNSAYQQRPRVYVTCRFGCFFFFWCADVCVHAMKNCFRISNYNPNYHTIAVYEKNQQQQKKTNVDMKSRRLFSHHHANAHEPVTQFQKGNILLKIASCCVCVRVCARGSYLLARKW